MRKSKKNIIYIGKPISFEADHFNENKNSTVFSLKGNFIDKRQNKKQK